MRYKLEEKLWWKICVWHWMLNPGLAFNELILGQRIPKDLIVDESIEGSLNQKQIMMCRDCGHEIKSKDLPKKAGFGMWIGYYCPMCKNEIPCYRNIFSKLILLVLYPIWFPIFKKWNSSLIEYSIKRIGTEPGSSQGFCG